jgi:hypothetical protein
MGHDWQAFEARHCATAAYCAVDRSNRCGEELQMEPMEEGEEGESEAAKSTSETAS